MPKKPPTMVTPVTPASKPERGSPQMGIGDFMQQQFDANRDDSTPAPPPARKAAKSPRKTPKTKTPRR